MHACVVCVCVCVCYEVTCACISEKLESAVCSLLTECDCNSRARSCHFDLSANSSVCNNCEVRAGCDSLSLSLSLVR